MYLTNPPEDTGDEVDVQTMAYVVFSVVGVLRPD
jgi:hypothetical protein